MRKFQRPSTAQLKLWRRLDAANLRHRAGLLLAEGLKVTAELLASAWETRAILVMEEKRAQWDSFLDGLPEGMIVYVLTEAEWGKLSQDTEPEGIMGLAAMPPQINNRVTPAELVPVKAGGKVHSSKFEVPHTGHLLLLYEVANPGNLGAILRTARWFGIGTVLLSTGSVDFTNPKVVRSSMGSIFHLTIVNDVDFAAVLPAIKGHFLLVAGDVRKGTSPHACTARAAILMGSESHGLPDSLIAMADERWCIAGSGSGESLSLPQAAAIMLYECTKQRP